eukprot:scaffold3657_cov100-Isochrysis_galbana.AAC.1
MAGTAATATQARGGARTRSPTPPSSGARPFEPCASSSCPCPSLSSLSSCPSVRPSRDSSRLACATGASPPRSPRSHSSLSRSATSPS